MSATQLGINFTCDLCDKVAHSAEFMPHNWSRVCAKTENGIMVTWTFHVCPSCWPEMKAQQRKTFVRKFLDMLK